MIKLFKELLGFLPTYMKRRSFFKKLIDIFFVTLIVFLSALLLQFVTKFDQILLALTHDETIIENNISASLHIDPILDQVNQSVDATGSAVFRYHNGIRGINGFSFLRKSATNIRLTNDETPPLYFLELVSNLSAGADLNQLSNHVDGNCLIRQVTPNLEFSAILRVSGTKTFASCPIFDNRNALVAYISVHWDEIITDETVLEKIQEYADQIGRHESFLTQL